MSSYMRVMKDVLSDRNIKVLLVSAGFWALSLSMWRPYWPLYAKELGASKEMIGILSMVQNLSNMLFALPGGMLADKFGRKKVIVWFTATRVFAPFVLFLGGTGEQLIPGLICLQLGHAYNPAYNSMIAESLPSRGRAAGFGTFRMIRAVFDAFAVFMGGVIMDSMGVLDGFRAMLFWSIFLILFVLWLRIKYLVETLKPKEHSSMRREEATDEKEPPMQAFRLSRNQSLMITVACLTNFAVYMIQPFLVVYAVEVIGLTTTEWGLIQSAIGLISAFLAIPGGMFADRFGRRPAILLARVTNPLSEFGLIFTSSFTQVLLVRILGGVSAGFGGGGPEQEVGGPAWQALISEMTPSWMRGRVMGLISALNGIVASPSSWVGGYLWESYNPQLIFWTALFIGLLPTSLLFFVKEPKREETDKK